MQYVKQFKVLIVTAILGTATAIFLTLATVPFTTPPADATPALAKGKSCKTCHASAKPSKADVKKKKKKKSELWPDERDSVAELAHFNLR